MSQFDDLRQLARDKRDTAIDAAKSEYHKELLSINALEKKLGRKPSLKGRPKPITALRVEIMEAIPTDRNFTVYDVLESLGMADTEKARVRTTFDRMINRKEIKRVRRGRKGNPALFAVWDFGPIPSELNDMSQIKAAETVLRDLGPSTLVELVVAMCERGYVAVSGKQTLARSLKSAMYHKSDFVCDDGKWRFRR